MRTIVVVVVLDISRGWWSVLGLLAVSVPDSGCSDGRPIDYKPVDV